MSANDTNGVNHANDTLALKLHPRRFTGMSGKMAAIVAYVLGEHWTTPEIAELIISDGVVLAREDGDIGYNSFIGAVEDLKRNVSNLLAAAGLTEQERETWDLLYSLKVAQG